MSEALKLVRTGGYSHAAWCLSAELEAPSHSRPHSAVERTADCVSLDGSYRCRTAIYTAKLTRFADRVSTFN